MPKIKDRPLTVSEIYSGYHAALRQARNLVSEANLLIEHDHFPGAFHRLVIAIEEIGKARILFYHGAFLMGEKPPPWKGFWAEYYSHKCKLDAALTWADLPQIVAMDDARLIDGACAASWEHATALDELKQATSYSEPTDDGFVIPITEDFRPRTSCLSRIAKSLLELADSSPLTQAANANEFEQLLKAKLQFAAALGYLDKKGRQAFGEKLALANQGLYVRGAFPTDEEFLARLAERYEIIPDLIPVTLQQLRTEPRFIEFYQRELKEFRGYPDWIILAVLFNLSLNARLDQAQMDNPSYRTRMASWREDPAADRPLDVGIFTDIDTFEKTLSSWLISFLAALGIALEDPGHYGEHARRVAAKHFGFFDRDVEHEPLLPALPLV